MSSLVKPQRLIWLLMVGASLLALSWARTDPSQRSYLANVLAQIKDMPGRYMV